jgi:hypothetical protein
MGELVHGYDRELYSEALVAARRCELAAESDDPDASQAGPAAAAIVLAEASLEAFVSESLALFEGTGTITADARKRIRRERHFWNKCRGLYEELSGESLDRSRIYHDRLLPLIKLRHCILHRAAEMRAPGEWPELIAPYRDRIDHVEGEGLHWTSQLFTFPTARWATWAAFFSRRKIHEALPRKTMPEKFYQAFTTWVLDLESPDAS